MMKVPELYRTRSGPMGSDASYGNCGAFDLSVKFGTPTYAIASDQGGWEHVSVSHPNKTPSWDEMAAVKDLFWDAEDCVLQFHPPHSLYVNKHPHCLHLWRPLQWSPTLPPTWMLV